MTSSLVGSEMCIRDRWCTLSQPVDLYKKNQLWDYVVEVIANPAERFHPAVSYTHLKLPTICSV
eukprot:1875728-Prorocentrum_lima.AAC.1